MKWRLSEGGGEALYELGVSDCGILIGMTDDEFSQSMETLRKMAHSLNAEISVVRRREVSGIARRKSDLDRGLREQRKIMYLEQMGIQRHKKGKKKDNYPLPYKFSPEDWIQLGNNFGTEEDTIESSVDAGVCTTFQVAEVLIRKMNDNQHFLEIRIAFLGGTDAGKSTLLGYLSHGELDNGRGKARLNLLRHRHEIETGRSSSISHSIIGFDSAGNLLNHNSGESTFRNDFLFNFGQESGESCTHNDCRGSRLVEGQIVEEASKVLMLIDTCGHPKYLRTTIQGLTGYSPDYACLVVDGLAGKVDDATKEVLGCALVLSVPVFVVLSKIDLSQESERAKDKLKDTLEALVHLFMLPGSSKIPVIIRNEDDVVVAVQNFVSSRVIPIFLSSSATGENVNLLIKFLNLLPSREAAFAQSTTSSDEEFQDSDQIPRGIEFQIEETYNVPSVGVVVGGRLISGRIYESTGSSNSINNQQLVIGPVDAIGGRFSPVEVTSIHRQRRPVASIKHGQSATLALKDLDKSMVRKGMVILSGANFQAHLEFEAHVTVLYAPDDCTSPKIFPEGAIMQFLDEFAGKRKSINNFENESASSASKKVFDKLPTVRPRWGNIHLGSVHQPAIILSIEPLSNQNQSGPEFDTDQISLSTGCRYTVHFRFVKNLEYVRIGSRLLYRERPVSIGSVKSGGLKMVGEVTRLIERTGFA